MEDFNKRGRYANHDVISVTDDCLTAQHLILSTIRINTIITAVLSQSNVINSLLTPKLFSEGIRNKFWVILGREHEYNIYIAEVFFHHHYYYYSSAIFKGKHFSAIVITFSPPKC